jgi:hypothetical protein
MINCVYIKLINGIKYKFFLDVYETVSHLKNKIEACLDIDKNTQRLLYRGSSLSDDYMLFNLPDKSVIHLILQLGTIPE